MAISKLLPRSRDTTRIAILRVLGGAILAIGPIHIGQAVEPVFPRALRFGDTIMVVAPAGPLDPKAIGLVRQRLEAAGFKVRIPKDLFRAADFLAGSDETRAAELMEAFRDPAVDAVFPGTGGYGTTRILDRLDYDTIRAHPKVFVGFSDITALHLAIHRRTGLVTFHSPNPMWGLGNKQNLTWFSDHWFWRAILANRYEDDPPVTSRGYRISALPANPADPKENYRDCCHIPLPECLAPGKATGRLTGGNLSLVAATMGTPYEIETEGRILFLEDVGEEPYRIDRMLSTLRLAGKLKPLAGVVLG
ncbi:MAG TPA: LD-carboxypeptidase, partial [Pirellulaceae bacterium]